jgi:type IV pilus assembly protein PilM
MSSLASWLASPPPDAAIEIAPGRVSAAAITSSFGGDVLVSGYAVEALPAEAVVASLTSHNVADRRTVAAAVRAALGRLGTRVSRVALVIPDISAKVSLVRFDKVPQRRDDLDQMVRWQIRKSAPFAVEDACVTYTSGARSSDGGAEFIVVLARRNVVEEYEGVCQDAGCYAGLVDIATFSVLNLFLASGHRPTGDWLAVHMRPEYTSISIMRDDDLIFFRNRYEGEEESLADLVHQTAMYYQDRLSGQGFARAVIGGMGRAAGSLDQARTNVELRLDLPVEVIDPTKVARVSDRIGVTPDLRDVLSPLIGILLRSRSTRQSARDKVSA